MGKLDLPDALVVAHLGELLAKFNAGDVPALFSAIKFSGEQEIAMPEWVVAAFVGAMNRWWSLEAASLDDAFGVRFPKGKHLAAARKKRRLKMAIYSEVKASIAGISPALFAAVGKQHNIGKTLAESYYYDAKRLIEAGPHAMNALLDPLMTRDAKVAASTRKVSKLSGSRSKPR